MRVSKVVRHFATVLIELEMLMILLLKSTRSDFT